MDNWDDVLKRFCQEQKIFIISWFWEVLVDCY